MAFINVKNLIYDYFRRDDDGNVNEVVEALSDINMTVRAGSYISIVGGNGSGKSTLAKNLNALLIPTEGTVIVDGMSTDEETKRIAIRKSTGMVFQNPDNQIVATVVEEDVAFGPENLGVKSSEIIKRVQEVLSIVGLSHYQSSLITSLSGGQKQKVAIAGILAMEPKCIILDEATSMLPPQDRKRILDLTHELNQTYDMTIIHITHYMEEILESDYVYAMSNGRIIFEGRPEALFAQKSIIKTCGLEIPLLWELQDYFGIRGVCNARQLAELIAKKVVAPRALLFEEEEKTLDFGNSLILNHVSYKYPGASKDAVTDASVAFQKGEFIGIVGDAGAGKSTLLQLMNGLLRPDMGEVYFENKDIHEKQYDLNALRRRVGLVFQYPEHQLFAENVFQDVVYGPYQQDITKVEAEKRAFQAIKDMHLDDSIYDMATTALSGGIKRKVAIAGVLAMKPDFMILDEPTAGLDPKSRQELLGYLKELVDNRGICVVVVSHSMDEVAEYTDRVIVLHEGSVMSDTSARALFTKADMLKEAGLMLPETMNFASELRASGLRLQPDIMKRQELLYALGINE